MSLIFLICSLRTNIIYFIVFLTLVVGFFLEAGEYFAIGAAAMNAAATLRIVSAYTLRWTYSLLLRAG